LDGGCRFGTCNRQRLRDVGDRRPIAPVAQATSAWTDALSRLRPCARISSRGVRPHVVILSTRLIVGWVGAHAHDAALACRQQSMNRSLDRICDCCSRGAQSRFESAAVSSNGHRLAAAGRSGRLALPVSRCRSRWSCARISAHPRETSSST
jgi:hypothetical protein